MFLAAIPLLTCLAVLGPSAHANSARLYGLLDEGRIPTFASVEAMDVSPHWSALEPSDGVFNWASLDQPVATAAAASLTVKLRINASPVPDTPAWVVAQAGSFQVHGTQPCCSSKVYTVARFWDPSYEAAWTQFVQALAAHIDGSPTVLDVVAAGCTMTSQEPYLREDTNPVNVTAILAAGYTLSADQACRTTEMQALGAFSQTDVGLPFSPYQQINPDGTTKISETTTAADITYFRGLYGSRASLENNGLSNSSAIGGRSPAGQMYATFKADGGPISLQAQHATNFSTAALSIALQVGAESVELPRGYGGIFSDTTLEPYDQLFDAQP